MAMSAARRRTITIYETLDSYNFYFPHVAASASATVVPVLPVLFPCIPQKANDDLQHPHPHALKRDVKVFNLCSQWKAGAHRPDQRLYLHLSLGLCLCLCLGLCLCVCVGRAWYGNISGHIMHFIAIEKYVSRVKI